MESKLSHGTDRSMNRISFFFSEERRKIIREMRQVDKRIDDHLKCVAAYVEKRRELLRTLKNLRGK